MKEKSLVLIKPDAVIDKKDKEITDFLRAKDIVVMHTVSIQCDQRKLKTLYPHVILEESISTMLENFSKGDAIVVVFEGVNAISVGLETKRAFREKYYYGYYGCTIHASDNEKEFKREISILLPDFLTKKQGD